MVRSGVVALLVALLGGGSIAGVVVQRDGVASAAVPQDAIHARLDARGAMVDFIDFTPRGTQPGLTHNLLHSNGCASCHGSTSDDPAVPVDHYPFNSWSGSMMAQATRDPLFWAALDVANHDGAQNGAEGIGDYCLRCHAPDAWHHGRVSKRVDVSPVGGQVPAGDVVEGFDGCMLYGQIDNPFDETDYGGVGCHVCHRVTETGPLGQPSFLENADIWLDDAACDLDGDGQPDPGGEPCRAGPYAYPTDLPFEGFEPPHAWKHSPLHSDSAMCGSCHDVTTPMLEDGPFRTLILDDGTLAGNDTGLPFPVERTFSEWQRSDYANVVFRDELEDGGAAIPGKRLARGETCQDCHMRQAQAPESAPDTELLACSFGPPRNGNLPVHEFVGGNTWVPNIIKGEYPNLGIDAAFDRTTALATEMLTERTAQVGARATRNGAGGLDVAVEVVNLAGHKLPTGYGEGRRMWITLEVRDANDALLWSNGDWDAATGDLARDAQTKVYEIKQGIWDSVTGTCTTTDTQGRDAFHFVLNNCVAKDNRIPPLGFTGATDPEMAAYGDTHPPESPGSARSSNVDVTQYTVPASALAGSPAYPLSVQASLRFQIASKDYIEFLRRQAADNAFAAENTLCADNPERPFTVGAQDRSRGEYMYQLWNSPAYGRSPPVAVDTATATVSQ